MRLRMSRKLKVKHMIVIIVVLTFSMLLYNSLSSPTDIGPILPLDDGAMCNVSLDSSVVKNLEKVNSYQFPKAQQYLRDLFPESADQSVPKFPTFVTAFDASHHMEGAGLVENINTVVRKKYRNIKLVIYDMGLTRAQKSGLQGACKCDIRDFPFDKFPKHVRYMKGYAWKPLAIQLVIKEHPFVFWMDASVRFTQRDLDPVFDRARKSQVMAASGYGPIAERTSLRTFKFLGEQPCTFRDVMEFEATFIIIHGDQFVKHNFLKPWVSCALTKECMVLGEDYEKYLDCDNKGVHRYFVCHRFDQAILSILMYRLFHPNAAEHKMDHTFFVFCKGQDEIWFVPRFVNKLLINFRDVKCF